MHMHALQVVLLRIEAEGAAKLPKGLNGLVPGLVF